MSEPRTRPSEMQGFTRRVRAGCGNLYVTVNRDELGVCEVFSALGKAGGCASAQLQAISRLVSLSLRAGVDPNVVVKSLRGIRCPSLAWENGEAVLSCPDAIGKVLSAALGEAVVPPADVVEKPIEEPLEEQGQSFRAETPESGCPDCGTPLIFQEGCCHCPVCGYSRCS